MKYKKEQIHPKVESSPAHKPDAGCPTFANS